jgi:hypothetical protein
VLLRLPGLRGRVWRVALACTTSGKTTAIPSLKRSPGTLRVFLCIWHATQVPGLVKEYMAGGTLLDKYITHQARRATRAASTACVLCARQLAHCGHERAGSPRQPAAVLGARGYVAVATAQLCAADPHDSKPASS